MAKEEIIVPKELEEDIEHVANGEWHMIEAKGTKMGNHTKGFHIVALMEEEELKAFVKRLLSTGIKAGIEYARNH
jgi:hypothetical protein